MVNEAYQILGLSQDINKKPEDVNTKIPCGSSIHFRFHVAFKKEKLPFCHLGSYVLTQTLYFTTMTAQKSRLNLYFLKSSFSKIKKSDFCIKSTLLTAELKKFEVLN